jgi:hypothetical protein
MDELVILTKIDSLHRCLRRIRGKTPQDVDTLISDLDRQDIIVLNVL